MLATRAAVVQLRATPDARHSLGRALHWTQAALERGAELVLLPENYAGIPPAGEPSEIQAEADDLSRCPAIAPWLELPRHVTYVLGGLPVRAGQRRQNTCVVVHRGAVAATYAKVHLFDGVMPDGRRLGETDKVERGEELVAVDGPWGRLGLSICYDLRFPELYRAYAEAGATLLAAPSAFTFPTGAAHWELLLRARAVENQAFVLAPAQWGVHAEGRHSWGRSMIVDPWGDVVVNVGTGEGIGVADLEPAALARARNAVPSLRHRVLSAETSVRTVTLAGSDGQA